MNSLKLKKVGPFWSLHFGSLKCILPKQLNEDKNITIDIQENEAFLITSDGSVYEIKIKDNEAINLEAMHQATVVTKCEEELIDTELRSFDHTNIVGTSAGYIEDTSNVLSQEIECVKPKLAVDLSNENGTVKSEKEKETLEESFENVQINSESGDVRPFSNQPPENVDTQLYVDNRLHEGNSSSFEEKTNLLLETGIASDKGELKYDIQEALNEQRLPTYKDETGSNASNRDISIKENVLKLETFGNESTGLQYKQPDQNAIVLNYLETLSSETKAMIIDESNLEFNLCTVGSKIDSDNVAAIETLLFSTETAANKNEERASSPSTDIGQEDTESFKNQYVSLSAIHQSFKQTRDQTATVSKISSSNKVKNSPNAPPGSPRSCIDATARPKTTPDITTQPSSDDKSDVFVCYTSTNIGVKVYKADILNVAVDCIVNAANENLNHNCGLAKVIAKRAGSAIVSECNDYRYQHNNNKIRVGNAVATTAGKLHYKCVVHAVGPLWIRYCPYTASNVKRCRDYLRNTIFQCLVTAEQKKMKSVAFPPVGAGLSGVPKEMCATAYADALIEYDNAVGSGPRELREVHFVDIDGPMVSLIKQTFEVMIKDRKPCPYSFHSSEYSQSNIHTTPVNNDRFRKQSVGERKDIVTNKPEQQHDKKFPSYREQDDKLVCEFSNSHTIHIYDGDIFAISGVKAIVYAEDETGFANKLKNIGKLFYKQKKVNVGDVVISRRGQHNFDWIINVVLPLRQHFKSYSEWKISFRNTFDRIFKKVIQEGITSVAMTIHETEKSYAESDEGSSGVRRCAEMFLDSYIVTHNRHSDKQLAVHMVNKESPKTECLANLFKEHIDTIKVNQVAELCLSISKDHKDSDVDRNVADKIAQNMNLEHQGNDRPSEKNALNNTLSVTRRSPQTEKCSICLSGIIRPMKLICYHTFCKDCIDKYFTNFSNYTPQVTRRSSQTKKCLICFGGINRPKKLICSHTFCTDCIDQYFKTNKMCPTCGQTCGILIGDQPPGDMVITKTTDLLAGFETFMTLSLTYTFKDGEHQMNHPNPGARYSGCKRIAYLPDTDEGREVCAMLSVAFTRKLTFTIGRLSSGEDVITWNNIQHKTSLTYEAIFGYPDLEYFDRVRGQLKSKGITEVNVDKGFLEKLKGLHITGTIKV